MKGARERRDGGSEMTAPHCARRRSAGTSTLHADQYLAKTAPGNSTCATAEYELLRLCESLLLAFPL